MKRVCLGIAFAAGLLAPPAIAQPSALSQALATGAVGERYDGYLGIAGAVSANVRKQVAGINIQRRTLYSKLASAKRVSPQEVAVTAGCQLLGRVSVGQSYLLSDGAWRRRGLADPSPQPGYCR